MKRNTLLIERPLVLLVALLAGGCSNRAAGGSDLGVDLATRRDKQVPAPDLADPAKDISHAFDSVYPDASPYDALPPPAPKDVDVLFVVDNSISMDQEQEKLIASFHAFLNSLISPKLGGRVPNIRIGVVSTDLGAGPYSVGDCRVGGGDGGKLQHEQRGVGCNTPADPWISYADGATNIPGCAATSASEALGCVDHAFGCIARLGTRGCGFEQPLESARLALSGTAGRNPGFLRKDALLAVFFVTDEDDCSARNSELFSPHGGPLGPLSSFRCFEFGIRCDINDRNQMGPRNNCVPAHDWLYRVDDYIKFFSGLKASRSHILMAAIAGPTLPVAVGKDGNNPKLLPSCVTGSGSAVPPIRLAHVIQAFGGKISSVCGDDYGPALQHLGKRVAAALAK